MVFARQLLKFNETLLENVLLNCFTTTLFNVVESDGDFIPDNEVVTTKLFSGEEQPSQPYRNHFVTVIPIRF